MLAKRWYPSAHLMPDGVRTVFLGGAVQGDLVLLENTAQSSDNYEMYPRTAPADAALRTLPVLTRAYPAPLYPFVHLMPNGSLFVMANYHAALFDFDTGEEVVLPDIPGAISRSYPYTGEDHELMRTFIRKVARIPPLRFNPDTKQKVPSTARLYNVYPVSARRSFDKLIKTHRHSQHSR